MKSLCSQSECRNGGSCEPISDIRYICTCVAGFTGEHCETNIGMVVIGMVILTK